MFIQEMIRDLGLFPTVLGFAFIALIIYSIIKGGKGGSGNGKGSGGTTPPPAA